jgi:hypothetical protein
MNQRMPSKVMLGDPSLGQSGILTDHWRLVPWVHSQRRRFSGGCQRTLDKSSVSHNPSARTSVLANCSSPLANRSLSDAIPPLSASGDRASQLKGENESPRSRSRLPLEALSVPDEHWSKMFNTGIMIAHALCGPSSLRLLVLLPSVHAIDVIDAHSQGLGS